MRRCFNGIKRTVAFIHLYSASPPLLVFHALDEAPVGQLFQDLHNLSLRRFGDPENNSSKTHNEETTLNHQANTRFYSTALGNL